jgi:transforming growth factor-beta-induced protein
MRKLFAVLLLAALALSASFAMAQDEQTIADIVVASATGDAPEFTALLGAVQAADPSILELLSNPEAELTVFAPTDAAFAALSEALMADMTAEEVSAMLTDSDVLTAVLGHHVIDGVVMSADVVAMLEGGQFNVETLTGQSVTISQVTEEMAMMTPEADMEMMEMMAPGIYVDGAMINLEMVDIVASNGVIHVIDAVLVPEFRSIAEIVVEAAGMEEGAEFTTLLAAVSAADPAVLEALSNPDAVLTVFAPTDAAFAALGEETIAAVLADQAMLTDILLYHVITDLAASSTDVSGLLADTMSAEVTMANGDTATIMMAEDGLFINESRIIITDVDAGNGVIHVIDAVLLPPTE